MSATSFILPLLLFSVTVYGLYTKTDVYAALLRGGADGLRVLFRILPALCALLPAIAMFRASGAMDALASFCGPVLDLLGVPAECAPLWMVRPFSGSGALAAAGEIIRSNGPDSYAGRVAAVMLGSSETTFYTIAVYFGAAGIQKTRHAVPAALIADITGFIAAAWAVRLFFGT